MARRSASEYRPLPSAVGVERILEGSAADSVIKAKPEDLGGLAARAVARRSATYGGSKEDSLRALFSDRSRRERVLDVVAQSGASALVWGLLLGTSDLWRCYTRSWGAALPGALGGLWLQAVGMVVAVVWPLALVRAPLCGWAGQRVPRRVLAGLLHGVLFAWPAFFLQRYATIGTLARGLFAAIVVAAIGAAFALAPRAPRATRVAWLALATSALALDWWLPVRQYPWLHAGVDLGGAAALASLIAPAIVRAPRSVTWAASGIALSAALLAPRMASESMAARGLVYDLSVHARAHAAILGSWLSPGSRPRALHRCPRGDTARCSGHVPEPVTPSLFGSARGADLLLLSVDALRWDQAQALPELLREMGPKVRFSRAVSPAPHTAYSFGALWRGRPVRQVPFDRKLKQRVARSATETLGTVLGKNGYRAVYAPTHRYLESRGRVAQGFEQLVDPGLLHLLTGSRSVHFPLQSALDQIVRAARTTPGPLLAWLHSMETHAPFHWQGGEGPANLAGQLHAARDLDKHLVRLVRNFKAARSGRPLVIVMFSDHGEEFGEHGGRFHSSTVYAEQVRVSFAISAPGMASRAIDAPVSTAAIPRTVLDLLGIEAPCSFTVPSLLLCIGPRGSCPTLAISELFESATGQEGLVAYTGVRHRLLQDRSHDVIHLFDADRDPYERRDLVESEPAVLADLTRAARAWDERYCATR